MVTKVRGSVAEPKQVAEPEIADDMLRGCAAIAGWLGEPEPRVERNLSRKTIYPAFKMGGLWHMRKSTYRRRVKQLEEEAAAS
jgi:hypothetical protein